MEIHHACRIQNCFAKCGFGTASSVNTDSDEENCESVELLGHIECPSNFKEFLNVDKWVPTTNDQPTSLDGPGPSSERVEGEEEEMMEEPRPSSSNPLSEKHEWCFRWCIQL
jgi:hypothetical protein